MESLRFLDMQFDEDSPFDEGIGIFFQLRKYSVIARIAQDYIEVYAYDLGAENSIDISMIIMYRKHWSYTDDLYEGKSIPMDFIDWCVREIEGKLP